MIPAGGGSILLHLDTRMALMKRKGVFIKKDRYYPRFESAKISEEDFFRGIKERDWKSYHEDRWQSSVSSRMHLAGHIDRIAGQQFARADPRFSQIYLERVYYRS